MAAQVVAVNHLVFLRVNLLWLSGFDWPFLYIRVCDWDINKANNLALDIWPTEKQIMSMNRDAIVPLTCLEL